MWPVRPNMNVLLLNRVFAGMPVMGIGLFGGGDIGNYSNRQYFPTMTYKKCFYPNIQSIFR